MLNWSLLQNYSLVCAQCSAGKGICWRPGLLPFSVRASEDAARISIAQQPLCYSKACDPLTQVPERTQLFSKGLPRSTYLAESCTVYQRTPPRSSSSRQQTRGHSELKETISSTMPGLVASVCTPSSQKAEAGRQGPAEGSRGESP